MEARKVAIRGRACSDDIKDLESDKASSSLKVRRILTKTRLE